MAELTERKGRVAETLRRVQHVPLAAKLYWLAKEDCRRLIQLSTCAIDRGATRAQDIVIIPLQR